jgi:hypothetical protein
MVEHEKAVARLEELTGGPLAASSARPPQKASQNLPHRHSGITPK